MNSVKIAILNITGYAGISLARILHKHPNVEIVSVTGRSDAGKQLNEIFPHMDSLDIQISVAVKPNYIEAKYRWYQDWESWIEEDIIDYCVIKINSNYQATKPL